MTMGPESAFRALHKAVSLGADRSVHLTDESLADSDVAATGYALAKVLEAESPDLVLLGQQSDDGECYTIGAVVADHLKMPSLTQVIKMDVAGGKLTCERQAEYGYDTVEIGLPAVISVGDAINEPRYPSLKAIMGAKKKPLDTKGDRRRRHRGRQGRRGRLAHEGPRDQPPAGQGSGRDHRGRGHERDGREDRRLARREEAAGMSGILTYALHYEGEFNKNSLGAVSEGAQARQGDRRRRRRRGRRRRRPDRRPLRIAGQVRRDEGLPRQRPGGPRRSGRRRDGQGHLGQRLLATPCSAAACWASRSAPASPPASTAA